MTAIVDHTELITLLENNGTITSAILDVANLAGTGDILATMDAVMRSHELILQAIKSNTAIIHQIQERNFRA